MVLLVKTICFLMMYVNHAINFYLYCLTGKRFRKELAAMLVCNGCSDESSGGGGGGARRDVRIVSGRRGVHMSQQHAPLNQAPPSSTSSRTRSARMMMMLNANPVRRSSSQLNDERYS